MKNIILIPFIFCLFSVALLAQNTISGNVICMNGGNVEGVSVELTGGTIGTMSTLTDGLGNYTFANIPSGEDYNLHLEKDGVSMNGVTTFDMVLIREAILDPTFDDPFFLLAADANDNGTISTYDLVLISKVILGIDDDFPVGPWRFATTDFDYSPPTGHVDDVPIVDLQGDLTINFVGVHVGDVNGSAEDCN